MDKGERDRPSKPENADVEIVAGAKTSELRFEKVPETETRFLGSSRRQAASGSDRYNLPRKVEPWVTYRDASIRWRAAVKLDADDRLRYPLGGEAEEPRGSSREARSEAQERKPQWRRKNDR